MRTVDDTVHRYGSSGSVIERPTGIVDGRRSHRRMWFDWPTRCLLDRLSTGMLLVKPMLQHPRDVFDRPAAVVVHSAKVMVVHVARVIFQPARVFDGAHRVVFDAAASHRRGRHRGRRGGVFNGGSRLFRANLLLDRSAHCLLQRSARLVMIDGGPHRIGRRLPYHRVDRPHRLHRSHRLGRTHAVLDRSHRRRIRRSARSAPASRYGVRTVAHATAAPTGGNTSGNAANTVTLSRPTDRVRIHFHFVEGIRLGAAPPHRYHSCRHMGGRTGAIVLAAFMLRPRSSTSSLSLPSRDVTLYAHCVTHAKPHTRQTRG